MRRESFLLKCTPVIVAVRIITALVNVQKREFLLLFYYREGFQALCTNGFKTSSAQI